MVFSFFKKKEENSMEKEMTEEQKNVENVKTTEH